jgi:hypothetical protein
VVLVVVAAVVYPTALLAPAVMAPWPKVILGAMVEHTPRTGVVVAVVVVQAGLAVLVTTVLEEVRAVLVFLAILLAHP